MGAESIPWKLLLSITWNNLIFPRVKKNLLWKKSLTLKKVHVIAVVVNATNPHSTMEPLGTAAEKEDLLWLEAASNFLGGEKKKVTLKYCRLDIFGI